LQLTGDDYGYSEIWVTEYERPIKDLLKAKDGTLALEWHQLDCLRTADHSFVIKMWIAINETGCLINTPARYR
jgi:hypothetical protein